MLASRAFREALERHYGVSDTSLVMVDIWSAGNYGTEEDRTRRLARLLCFLRSDPTDNGYARPIEGIRPVVDLNSMVSDSAEFAQSDALDPLVWLAESREAAIAHACTHEVMGPIKATMEEGGELPEIYFSESYLQQAGKLARLRAAAAGKRLAAIWREGLK